MKMHIGCCASMIRPEVDPVGIQSLETLQTLGFDYIELSLSHLAALGGQEFRDLAAQVAASGLPCLACNNFFPRDIRLTGADANLEAAVEYAKRALDRAAQLGVQYVVFGSAGAKNVPARFSTETARRQIVELLRQLGPAAAERSLCITIEPISRPESNIVLTAEEGYQLLCDVDHPNVRLLIDYFHLAQENESPEIVSKVGEAIRHVHVATVPERQFPRQITPGMQSFFTKLRQVGYSGGLSIEAFTSDFAADAAAALSVLREATAD